jgi:hypothetical protein
MPASTESHCPSSKSNLTTGNFITARGAEESTFCADVEVGAGVVSEGV